LRVQNADAWYIGLELPSLELEFERPVPIEITFDGRTQYHVFGVPRSKHELSILMQAGAVSEQFRRAASLSIFLQGKYYSFSLAGTTRLLPALVNCVRTNGTLTRPPDAELVATRLPTFYYGDENVDYKISPQETLKSDVGTRTPLTVPGVPTVTTTGLMDSILNGRPMILIDALRDQHAQTIRGAVSLPDAGAYGSGTFHDHVQTQLAKALSDLAQGRAGVPLIFFCEGVKCWESYNAVLRARAAGFPNIAWYRGGLDAWKAAGFPLQPYPTPATPTSPATAAPVSPQPNPTDATLATPVTAAPVPLQPNAMDATPANPSSAAPVATRPRAVYYGNENVDFKVRPQNTLKRDVGKPTPLTVPGVPTMTTTDLMGSMQSGRPMILIDALQDHHAQTIKGAISLPDAGAYGTGTFHDDVQTRLAQALSDVMQGRAGVPLIFFCEGVRCWESYNAVLRARAAGFPNIAWYRGGLDAWTEAGFPLQPN
jgi:PQQ-dependent catabolism-associated CXXCW motif protein